MKRVLVTGGRGVLGSAVTRELLSAGYTVRIMSRRSQATSQWSAEVEWVQADLATGQGLSEAVADVDTIIHAATDAGVSYESATMSDFINKALLNHDGSTDVQGTKLLLEHAHAAGVRHCIYVSIVGIEHIPFAYYRHKLEAEAIVREAGVQWSVARATQFHALIDALIRTSAKWPILMLPTDFRIQPIDPIDVARHLCNAVTHGPGGNLPDIGGPETLTLGAMTHTWLSTHRSKKLMVRVPLPGKTARELRQGALTCPNGLRGTITWKEWLRDARV